MQLILVTRLNPITDAVFSHGLTRQNLCKSASINWPTDASWPQVRMLWCQRSYRNRHTVNPQYTTLYSDATRTWLSRDQVSSMCQSVVSI